MPLNSVSSTDVDGEDWFVGSLGTAVLLMPVRVSISDRAGASPLDVADGMSIVVGGESATMLEVSSGMLVGGKTIA